MEPGTLERLKRVYELAGIAPESSFKKRKLGYNVRFIERDLPKVIEPTNKSGYFSSHIQVHNSAPGEVKEQMYYRERPKGIDFRLENALKTYRPPKPLPVKAVRFEEIPQIKTIETPKEPVIEVHQPKSEQKPFKFGSEASAGATTGATQTDTTPSVAVAPSIGAPPFSFENDAKSSSEPKKSSLGTAREPTSLQANPESKKPFSFGPSGEQEPNKPFTFGSGDKNSVKILPQSLSDEQSSTKKQSLFGSNSESKKDEPVKKPFSFGAPLEEPSKKPFSFGSSEDSSKAPQAPFSFGTIGPSATGSKPISSSRGVSGATNGGNSTTSANTTPAFGNATSTPFAFGAASTSSAAGTGASLGGSQANTLGAPATIDNQPKPQFSEKPSFNFGASGSALFGANSETAAPAFKANSSVAPFGASSTPSPAFGNNPLAGGTNTLAGGTNNARKIAPLRRRIPK